jgi:DNA-directed RNA polymerase specialized sigma24 family protein
VREPVQSGADAPMRAESGEVDGHLAHLFDYCRALLGRDDDAAATARAVMASAAGLPDDPERLRARLFAEARSRAVAMLPAGSDAPWYQAPEATAAAGEQSRAVALSAFGALTYRDREILDLVYRHGIRPWDLSAVLAIPAEEAYRRLVNAEEEFISLAPGPGASGAYLDEVADLPLAAVPASHAASRVRRLGPAGSVEGPAPSRPPARRLVLLAAAAGIAVAAIAWGASYFDGPEHAGGSHPPAALPGTGAGLPHPSPSRPARPVPAARPRHSAPPDIPIAVLLPVPGRSAPPGVTLLPPLVSASPSPSPSPSASASLSASPSPPASPSLSPSASASSSPSPTDSSPASSSASP